jgi:hypothetical protein
MHIQNKGGENVTIEAYVYQRCTESEWFNEPALKWLTEDYSKRSSVYSNNRRLEGFCEWYGKTGNEIVLRYV